MVAMQVARYCVMGWTARGCEEGRGRDVEDPVGSPGVYVASSSMRERERERERRVDVRSF